MTLQEMVAMELNQRLAGIIRVPGGWIYEGRRDSGVFVPEPFDRAQGKADYEEGLMKALEQAGEQLGERLKAHDEAIEKRILAYDAHLQAVLASLGRAPNKEPVQ